MALQSPVALDTRALFRPVSGNLVVLLRTLSPQLWELPTIARGWAVRDVVAHLLDSTLRRLSFHRDGMIPPSPPGAIESERDFVQFINDLNAQWVTAARRLSPRVLTNLYERASREAADWFESIPLEAPALFPVSWAGEAASAGWFDIGREFTELWHHQQQIRMAVGADEPDHPRYLQAVIDIAVRGLPHAFRHVQAEPDDTLQIDITGDSGGRWTLERQQHSWVLWVGHASEATARVRLDDQTAWKLLFNALPARDAADRIDLEGRLELAGALLHARSVIV